MDSKNVTTFIVVVVALAAYDLILKSIFLSLAKSIGIVK